MADDSPPPTESVYTDNDFDLLGFHDCRIRSIRWNTDDISLTFEIDYIVKWVHPKEGEIYFSFWLAPALLTFENASEAVIELKWARERPDCQIDDLLRGESRLTPNGRTMTQWELALSQPDGEISVWAIGFTLKLLSAPQLSASQRLP